MAPRGGSVKQLARVAATRTRLGCILPFEIAVRLYGGTDKAAHGYGPGYARHLGRRRLARQRVLEIGVGGYESSTPGGSLRVWRDLLPRARVVGMDINEKVVDLGPRVAFVRGDQSSPDDLDRAVAALGGPPTIVIDDGSHYEHHAIVSFAHLWPTMPSGSLYVVEDLHTSYWPKFGGQNPASPDSAVGLVRSLVDSAQAADPTFGWEEVRSQPGHDGPDDPYGAIRSVDVHPGIAFIEKS